MWTAKNYTISSSVDLYFIIAIPKLIRNKYRPPGAAGFYVNNKTPDKEKNHARFWRNHRPDGRVEYFRAATPL
jgi:hypothetical protein